MKRILTALGLALCFFYAPASGEENTPRSFISVDEKSFAQIQQLHDRAARLEEENKLNEAILAYNEILLIEPDEESAYTAMGRLYMALGNYSGAEEAFWNALHINPENETALVGLKKIKDPDGV